MIQTGQDHDGPLQDAVDLTQDLNQQTGVVCGQLQVWEKVEGSVVSVEVDGDEEERQGRVYEGQGNTETPHEAAADVSPLEKHQGPVQEALPTQTEQDGGYGDVHGVWPRGALWTVNHDDGDPAGQRRLKY